MNNSEKIENQMVRNNINILNMHDTKENINKQ